MRNLNENLHAMEKKLMQELLVGKKSAIQLRTLLHNPPIDEGSISKKELAMNILRSFDTGISIVSSHATAAALPDLIDTVDCVGGKGSACSGEGKRKVVKDKRGCYKRRALYSWIKVCPIVEDGYGWRKYGQKLIMNSENPRCYYRCTHRSHGCKAKKQVQKIKEDPLYKITYINQHTCTDTQIMLPQHIVESDQIEANLLSFQGCNYILSPKPANVSSVKEEFEAVDTQSIGFAYGKSTAINTGSWQVTTGSGSRSGCSKQLLSPGIQVAGDDVEEEVSGLYSCASMTSFHGLDLEVDQLGDIDFEQWQ